MLKFKIFLFIFALSLLLGGCSGSTTENNNAAEYSKEHTNSSEALEMESSYPVYRAMAARMISLIFFNGGEDAAQEFLDVKNTDWYYGYINDICANGIMQGEGDIFSPMEPLTYRQAQTILQKLGITTADKNIEDSDVPVSYKLWCEMLFSGIEDKLSDYDVEKKQLGIFATAGYGSMASWTVSTSEGNMSHYGLYMDSFVDKTIEAYVKGNEIIAVSDISGSTCEIKGAFLKNSGVGENAVAVFGGVREMNCDTEFNDGVYDIVTQNGSIISISQEYAKISDTVKKYDDECIETEDNWVIEKNKSFRVYVNGSGAVYEGGMNNIICGGDYDFYVKDNKIWAAVSGDIKFGGNMRILISTDGYNGYYHSSVSLKGSGLKVTGLGNELYSGNNLELSENDDKGFFDLGNRIIISAKDGIEIVSLNRNYPSGEHPKYSGKIEIEKTGQGYVIVNETDMESYLEGVIGSEMPLSYGIVPAMVQAVCARSYAYNQYFGNKYASFGANCDDSTMSQVYNNTPPSETAKEACERTKGQCIVYNGEVINASFFASSCGSTANSWEVWAEADGTFPSAPKEYLSSRNNTGVDFSDESQALLYFKNTEAYAYDSWNKWFRWNVTFTPKQIEESFKNNVKSVYSPELIKINSQTDYESFMENPGIFEDMEVIERGEGGNIMILRLYFENGTADVYTEYNIRTILKPVGYSSDDVVINTNDGEQVYNYSLLPSAFFSFEKEKNDDGSLKSITLFGGGIGHGAGMSQNGVKTMADNGEGVEEIIKTYYKNTELKKMY